MSQSLTHHDSPNSTTKAVLITGGAKRIGRVIASSLVDDGWAVAIHYRSSKAEADTMVLGIHQIGGRGVAVHADLSREEEVQTLIDRAAEGLGQPITALVNNASVFDYDSALSTTRESWDRHMETNLRAPFVLIQALVRALPEGQSGAVVNILDQRVWNLNEHFTSYTLSKVGLWALTQTMAMALAPRLRVNAVGPGPTLPSSRQTADSFAKQVAGLPLKRAVSPQSVAEAVRYLLAAGAVTGQMIAVDGGQHLGRPLYDGEDDPGE